MVTSLRNLPANLLHCSTMMIFELVSCKLTYYTSVMATWLILECILFTFWNNMLPQTISWNFSWWWVIFHFHDIFRLQLFCVQVQSRKNYPRFHLPKIVTRVEVHLLWKPLERSMNSQIGLINCMLRVLNAERYQTFVCGLSTLMIFPVLSRLNNSKTDWG